MTTPEATDDRLRKRIKLSRTFDVVESIAHHPGMTTEEVLSEVGASQTNGGSGLTLLNSLVRDGILERGGGPLTNYSLTKDGAESLLGLCAELIDRCMEIQDSLDPTLNQY